MQKKLKKEKGYCCSPTEPNACAARCTCSYLRMPEVQPDAAGVGSLCLEQVARSFSRAYGLGMTVREEMEAAYQGERATPSHCGRMDQVRSRRSRFLCWIHCIGEASLLFQGGMSPSQVERMPDGHSSCSPSRLQGTDVNLSHCTRDHRPKTLNPINLKGTDVNISHCTRDDRLPSNKNKKRKIY
jgi:hypothetical protein